MSRTKKTKLQRATSAHKLWEKIQDLQQNIITNFLWLGKAFRVMRDELGFKDLGYDTFNQFVAQPEIHYSISTVRNCMWVSEVAENLKIINRMERIGFGKSQIITPLLTENKEENEEWLSKAESLSRSDLINETRKARGKPPMGASGGKKSLPAVTSYPPLPSYKQHVKEYDRCCVCGNPKNHLHHYPLTRKRTDDFDKVIPLCNSCHREAHDNPNDWKLQTLNSVCDFIFNSPSIGGKK